MNTDTPATITVEEICHHWQISRQTVERLRRAGQLPKPFRLGRLVRYPREETIKALERTRGVGV